ncbi:hypothetical protein [Fastidiosibacter lacustris]|uniref:hypothetical protein n=1 Tax=Fastidiosibacter lacustris TaxID=2056695 RepID=UPI000E34AB4D|nr:hypothetical protein [Fastidiosibacter lacustris]
MKKALVFSFLIHVVVIATLTLINFYIFVPIHKELIFSNHLQSIPAHIVYFTQPHITNIENTPNSTQNKFNFIKRHSTVEQSPILVITSNKPKFVTPLETKGNQQKNNIDLTDTPKFTQQVTSYSTSREVQQALSHLQSALTELLNQHNPDYSTKFDIYITLEKSGTIKSIVFSPSPPNQLKEYILYFLHQQSYTKKLSFKDDVNINIPIQLVF